MSLTREDAVAALKAFGEAYRAEGETGFNTVLLWNGAIQIQAAYRRQEAAKSAIEDVSR